ncbi:DUF5057 domain-containing protein [Exiguobacterium chiriqhucha]|uniref:DUF5057 domain-containing protein n=1 Tax=Exiguobacterium chiriqhucha TaxID=1385984 RepID=UPI0038B92779
MRKFLHILIIVILLGSVAPPTGSANTNQPPLNVLILRDAFSSAKTLTVDQYKAAIDTYRASLNVDSAKLNVHFMTIKEFNASRFPMTGAYDAVMIGSSPLSVKYQTGTIGRNANHDTTLQFNDLTALKVDELFNSIVRVGLPLYVHEDATTGGPQLKRLTSYSTYANVSVFPKEGEKNIDQQMVQQLTKLTGIRPRLTSTSVTYNQQPITNNTITVQQDVRAPINFAYNLAVSPSPATIVELYIDFDHNDRFQPQEKVVEQAAKLTGTIDFTLSRPTFSGPKNWMLVVKDTITGRADYKKGSFIYVDQRVQANILQLTAGTSTNGQISRDLADMLVDPDGNYAFKLTNGNTDSFGKGAYDTSLTANEYDMLIFGFQDSYNVSGSMSESATRKVKRFSETGQGVMLTHDTIFRTNSADAPTSEWERQFVHQDAALNISGQRTFTNMGFSAPEQTSRAIKVQDGIFTNYPFKLDASPKSISNTHNQYFTLDLNDPEVTPWYNLYSMSGNRVYGDANNHYYTYTKNNFTYSGAGHTNRFTQLDEKKIFINTMYRAFIGANHKPYNVVESINDQVNAYSKEDIKTKTLEVTAGRDVRIMWRPSDYDFQDQSLTSTFTYNGKTSTFENLRNYEVREFVIPAADVIEGKPLSISIETTDKRNAKVTDTLMINVKRPESVSDLIKVTRSIDPSTISLYETGTINYQVEYPEQFDRLPNQLGDKFIRMNMATFTEQLPKELEVVAIRDAAGNELPVSNAQKIDVAFPLELYYLRNGSVNVFLPEESGNRRLTFDVVVRAVQPSASILQLKQADNALKTEIEYSKKQDHILDKHNDWDKETTITSKFSDLFINIGSPFAYKATIPDVTLQIGAEQVVSPVITDAKGNVFTNPNWKTLKWEVVGNDGFVQLSGLGNNAVIKGIKTGQAKLRLTIEPGDGRPAITAESTVKVISPPEQIQINAQSLYVGQKVTVTPSVMPSTAQFETVRYETVSGDSISFVQKGAALEISGLKPGNTVMKATVDAGDVFTNLNVRMPSTTFTVTVLAPSLTQTPEQLDLWVWDSLDAEKRVNDTASIRIVSNPEVGKETIAVGTVPAALTVTRTASGYTLRANHGYGSDGNVTSISLQTAFVETALQSVVSNPTVIRVNEYPNQVLAQDMNINIGEGTAPRSPSLQFWPTTSTWRDYRLNVLSGEAFVKVNGSGKQLVPVKPGIAKVQVYTTLPSGRTFIPVTDTFYVRVIETSGESKDDRY